MKPTAFLLLLLLPLLCRGQELPEDFYDIPLITGLDFPTGLTFDGQGRMYIWEKRGVVHVADTAGNLYPSPLIDLSEEVSNWMDHGLMGFALDKDFLVNGYFYLLYALDLHHYRHYGTPAYHPDSTITWQPTIGRLTRYRADPTAGSPKVLEGSRKVLLGETLSDGIPLMYEFHGLGDLLMGEDGTLLVSAGDGTSNGGSDTGGDEHGTMASAALASGVITEDQDIGSYRAQYLGNLNGKVLRIDAETGDGLPSNPFYDAAAPRSAQSRIWAYGLRNPYRMQLRPNTGSHFPAEGNPGVLYIGDVGNGAWEELNIASEGGLNFGWPIMEGIGSHWPYINEPAPANQLRPNPLYGDNCDQPYFNFKELYTNPRRGGHDIPTNPCDNSLPVTGYAVGSLPVLQWSNARWNPPTRAQVPSFNEQGYYVGADLGSEASGYPELSGFDGFSALSGVFYQGDHYPEHYRGQLFLLDFSGWIKVAGFDDEQQLDSIMPFHHNAKDIIHLDQNPVDGKLYYLNLAGELHQISYGGAPPPVADIGQEQYYGPGPLTVDFDGSASYGPALPIVSYEWDFGDGDTASGPQASHTFQGVDETAQSFTVKLTVTDSSGATASDEAVVSLNNTPPQATITSFQDGDRYPIDQGTSLLRLAAQVSDAEHKDEELSYEWRTFLHHNDHFHPAPPDFERESFLLTSPLGCQEELYWYRIQLKVSDPGGLSATVTQQVYPYCGSPFLEGLTLSGKPIEGGVHLDWSVNWTDSLAYFEPERSPDGQQFNALGQVPAQGAGDYTFVDDGPHLGTNTYRIKAVSESGAYRYSNLESIGYPEPLSVQVYPNPVRNAFTVLVLEAADEEVELELLDVTGRVVFTRTWQTVPGQENERRLLPNQLPNGLYHYRLANGDQQYLGSLLIAR